jgi:hypothetical protein
MSPFVKTPDPVIAAMRAAAAGGMTTDEIAAKHGVNVTTARKWCRGYHKRDQPIESIQQPQPEIGIKPSEPVIIPPSRRSEGKTVLSDSADVLSDLGRSMMNVEVVKQLMGGGKQEDSLDKAMQFSQLLLAEAERRNEAERERRVEAEHHATAAAEKVGQLNLQLLQQQNREIELKFELGLEKIHAEMEANKKSQAMEKAESIILLGEKMPKIVGDAVTQSLRAMREGGLPAGLVLQRGRAVSDMIIEEADPQIGGMVLQEPLHVSEIRRRSRATIVAGPPRPAPYQRTDEELLDDVGNFVEAAGMNRTEMERDIREVREDADQNRRRDFLAGELAKSRAKIAELEEQVKRGGPPRPGPSISEIPQTVRKVITAAPAVEPEKASQ